jgi:hypothetical protein
MTTSALRQMAYQLDPALWVREQLNVTPMPWQDSFLRAPRRASIIALTARQVGKTTTAACAIAHTALYCPGSLSVIACPAQRQSGEAVRRVKDMLVKLGMKLISDNVYGLELENGSRVLGLPGSEDSIRGLTVDGWIVADEAARLSPEMLAALRPMRAQTQARFAMLSTAWTRIDPFWEIWSRDDPTWMRLKATADMKTILRPEHLDDERRNMTEADFKREYLGIPASDEASPFIWELYDRATAVRMPLVRAGRVFQPQPEAPGVVQPNPFSILKPQGISP